MAAASQTGEAMDRVQGADRFDQLPRSIEAERAVLGSILLLPEVCDDVALIIRPDDFFDQANQQLFVQMLGLTESGQRVDHMLLIERLKSAGQYDAVGGTAYVAEIAQAVPTAAHAQFYAEIIHQKALLRSLIRAGTEILRDAYDATADARQMLNRAEEKVFSILDSKAGGQISTVGEVLHESLLRLDARMKHEHAIGGLETGLSDYDDLTGGLHDSELNILAGRPSMGKTALALNFAEHAVLKKNAPTLFVSLEMSSVELGDRLLCSVAQVDSNRLRNGTISNDERRKLVEQAAKISQSPLFVDDSPSRTVTEIAAAARRLKRKDDLKLIVIDYLQLIEPDNAKDPRQEQVAKIARRLKGLARELKVPILCLAQLNRQAEATKDNRPRLSHLRESGAIEQDADVVMFVHREEYYQTNDEERQRVKGMADLIVAKQRNGPIGEVKLTWRPQFTRFDDATSQPYDELEAYEPEYF